MAAHALSAQPLEAEADTNPQPAPNDDGVGALTLGLVRGEEAAFRTFHDHYQARVWRYLLVVCRGDEGSAKDALQDTWLRVARHARRFTREPDLWRWIASLARSAAVDGARRHARYRSAIARYELALVPGDASPASSLDSGDPSALLARLLEAGMAQLPADDHALLTARYRQGQSVREIATQLGVSEKALESRLVRLRGRLRHQLLQQLAHEHSS